MSRHSANVQGETGTMGFTELSSTDSTKSRSFLEKAFSWKFETVQMPTGEYHTYRTPDGNMLGIRRSQPSEVPTSMNYVRVMDLVGADRRVREAGGTIVLPRTDIPGMGSFFWFKIPAGPMMACWQDAPQSGAK